jgi:hypothetical protein
MNGAVCNFREGDYLLVCKADKQVYVPTLFEMHAYCQDTQYRICPHYLNAEKRSRFKPRPPRLLKVD